MNRSRLFADSVGFFEDAAINLLIASALGWSATAGTIVANYDGANKHVTVSEDEAHTGSNSVLVALAGAAVGALLAFRLERRKAKDDREAAASAAALDLAGRRAMARDLALLTLAQNLQRLM
jgi:hypothetical protein